MYCLCLVPTSTIVDFSCRLIFILLVMAANIHYDLDKTNKRRWEINDELFKRDCKLSSMEFNGRFRSHKFGIVKMLHQHDDACIF